MDILYVKKQPNGQGGVAYVVPAVGIQTPEGLRRIPHPYGTDVSLFDTLEAAITQVHRAGYPMECDGILYPLPERTAKLGKPGRARIHQLTSVEAILDQALPMLQRQLEDTAPSVVASAAFALGEMRDERALAGLIHALGHEDATVRKHVAEALAKLGKPAFLAIQTAFKDKHWLVRHSALAVVIELIPLKFELVAELLTHVPPLLKDDNWLVRSQAATVLGEAARMARQLSQNES